jgi:hypothetical protein
MGELRPDFKASNAWLAIGERTLLRQRVHFNLCVSRDIPMVLHRARPKRVK